MSDFYKELKELRLEAGIDLEEIHNRTKISLAALRAIENGQFSQLPHTYIRLFVRAYANEIGADENQTLKELEKFLNKELIADKEKQPTNNLQEIIQGTENKLIDQLKHSSISTKNIRTDMVKGIALLSILIFSIYESEYRTEPFYIRTSPLLH